MKGQYFKFLNYKRRYFIKKNEIFYYLNNYYQFNSNSFKFLYNYLKKKNISKRLLDNSFFSEGKNSNLLNMTNNSRFFIIKKFFLFIISNLFYYRFLNFLNLKDFELINQNFYSFFSFTTTKPKVKKKWPYLWRKSGYSKYLSKRTKLKKKLSGLLVQPWYYPVNDYILDDYAIKKSPTFHKLWDIEFLGDHETYFCLFKAKKTNKNNLFITVLSSLTNKIIVQSYIGIFSRTSGKNKKQAILKNRITAKMTAITVCDLFHLRTLHKNVQLIVLIHNRKLLRLERKGMIVFMKRMKNTWSKVYRRNLITKLSREFREKSDVKRNLKFNFWIKGNVSWSDLKKKDLDDMYSNRSSLYDIKLGKSFKSFFGQKFKRYKRSEADMKYRYKELNLSLNYFYCLMNDTSYFSYNIKKNLKFKRYLFIGVANRNKLKSPLKMKFVGFLNIYGRNHSLPNRGRKIRKL